MKKKNFSVLPFFIMFIFIFITGCKKNTNVEEINILFKEEIVYVDETFKLDVLVLPENATNKNVILTSSDEDVAVVDGQYITVLKEGTFTITVTSVMNEAVKNYLNLEAKIRIPDSIWIEGVKDTIYIGDTLDLDVLASPNNAKSDFTWTLRDDTTEWDVAKIEGNTLTALNYGKVYLTCTSIYNSSIYETKEITVLHHLLEEPIYEAKYIRGAYGADSSHEFCIHYSIMNTKSFALVTTKDDPGFLNAKKYYGNGYYMEDLDKNLITPFTARNIWHIEVNDLKENTEYIYKIDNGNGTYSDIYSFKTSGKGSLTSFLFITDNHYFRGTDGTTSSAAVSENIIKEALKYNRNISFVLDGGDLIDTGGDSLAWEKYFEYAQMLKVLPTIGVPGNHEYYINKTAQKDNRFFKAYSANPLNGPASLKGSASWFLFNEVLFILIDNAKNTDYEAQQNWVRDLLETKEYKYSVAVFHIPVNFDNSDHDENYLKLFDKHSVDLVLTGHYHYEVVHKNVYDGKPSEIPFKGTTYFMGSFAGVKGAGSRDPLTVAKGYICDVTDNGIKIQAIYANGTLGETWLVGNNSCGDSVFEEKDSLMNSIKQTYIEKENKVKFTWSPYFYGNCKKIIIKEIYRNKISDYSVFPSMAYTDLEFDNIVKGYDYSFEVSAIFNDGTVLKKYFKNELHTRLDISFEDITSTSCNLSFTALVGTIRLEVYKFKVYLNDALLGEFKYLDHMKDVTTYALNNLEKGKTYKVTLVATDRQNNIYFTESTDLRI